MKLKRSAPAALLICLGLLLSLAACRTKQTTLPTSDPPAATAAPVTTEAPVTTTESPARPVYTGEWIEKTEAQRVDFTPSDPVVISEIYADCFFARPLYPMPESIKINAVLSEEWCVGDQVSCSYENVYYDEETCRFEADLVEIRASNVQLDPDAVYKPVIYLYPEAETEVTVKLRLNGSLRCTYPAYGDGWTVTARPDGTLWDGVRTYNYLFWDGALQANYDFSAGFCVKGSDTAAFLETALEQLGLDRREANEFIVFWLEKMQDNPYNVIAFQTEAYTRAAEMEITPQPDTLIRVFMAWYPSQTWVKLPAQTLTAPQRTGFTVVEWGGAELRQ